jgi:hypothetical protein
VAITPPSDIVLDVARAADPERYRAAVERLARLRAAAGAETTGAPRSADGRATVDGPTGRAAPHALAAHGHGHSHGMPIPRRRLDAYGQFEAFVLQSFIESMLPRNATNVYGRGTAGEIWRSMLAEKMGEELARSGQVGIARRLAAAAPAPDAVPAPDGPPTSGRS